MSRIKSEAFGAAGIVIVLAISSSEQRGDAGCSITDVCGGRSGNERSGRRFHCLVSRHLNDMEVFLRDQMPFHPQPEFIATGSGKYQGGDIDAKVGNLKAVADGNIGKGGTADQL